jgi:Flp pilus assembly protein TadD
MHFQTPALTAIALALTASPVPAAANFAMPRSALNDYVRARAADAAGLTDLSAQNYAAALTAAPGEVLLAQRALRQAIVAGDRALAMRAVTILEKADEVPPDGHLLLLADAVLRRDWRRASAAADVIEEEQLFAFAVPVLRAWIAFGRRSGDPFALLDEARAKGAIANAYAADHRPLLMLATGRYAEGMSAVQALSAGGGRGISLRLKLAAAAKLAKAREPAKAEILLAGPEPLLVTARERLADGRRLPASVDSAADGIAELFARVAVDVNRERVTPLSITFARLATFLAPQNAETWLLTADMLSADGHHDAALSALTNVAPDDVYADTARFERVQILTRKGEQDAALAEAQAGTARAGADVAAWSRLGRIQSDMERHGDAAKSFGRALDLARKEKDDSQIWTLLTMQAAALLAADDWPKAKAALADALKIAPDEPTILNFLGYAQIERRENMAEAERLIARAAKLRPDDPAITDSLGWTYYLRGDVTQAVPILERAVMGEPADPTINEHLGDAYWSAGRRIDARHAWNAALVYASEKDAARIGAKIDRGWTPEVAAP